MRINTVVVLASALAVVVTAGLGAEQKPSKPSKPAGATGAAATSPPKWPIAFVDTASPSTRVGSSSHLTIAPLIGNASRNAQNVAVSVVLRSVTGALVTTDLSCPPADGSNAPAPNAPASNAPASNAPASKTCQIAVPAAGSVVAVPMVIGIRDTPRHAYPLNGLVTLEPIGAATWSEERPRATLVLTGIALDSPPGQNQDWNIVIGSAWFASYAVAAGMIVCLILWDPGLLFRRMGSATFSFTASWSNALMVGTPLITAFLTTFSAFPENAATMSRKSYILLSVLLSALIALGPAIFNLCKLPTVVTNSDQTESTQPQGLVVAFFVAAFVTLTGGFGELQLLTFVLSDLTSAAFVSQSLGDALVWAASILFWIVFVASVVSLVTTVAAATAHVKPTKDAKGSLRDLAKKLETDSNAKQSVAGAGQRLPTWSMP